MKKDDFFALLAVPARAAFLATGVPAGFTLAQAALESAWGESGLAKSGKNLFGVKADKAWKGATMTLPTREFVNGAWVTVPASWRKYSTWEECLVDHANFLKANKRYQAAFVRTDSSEAFAQAIAAAGYATDPNYAAKLIAVIRSNNLIKYDQPLEKSA